MLNNFLKVVLAVVLLGGIFFFVAGERGAPRNVLEKLQHVRVDQQLKKLRQTYIDQVNAQWERMIARYRQAEADQELMLAGLNKNARNLAGNLMEMADLQAFLFASLAGVDPETASKRFLEDREGSVLQNASQKDTAESDKKKLLENARHQLDLASNTSESGNVDRQEVLRRIQNLGDQQRRALEQSHRDYEQAMSRYRAFQKEQADLLENSRKVLAQQENLFEADGFHRDLLEEQQKNFIEGQQQTLAQQQAILAMQNENFEMTAELYRQLQDQQNFYIENISAGLEDFQVHKEENMMKLMNDQTIFLKEKNLRFEELLSEQRELQKVKRRLAEDLLRSVELNKQWTQDRVEQIQRQHQSLVENRRADFETITERQKLKTEQLKAQQDLAVEQLRNQQRALRELQKIQTN